jgi:hypothetical protein
MLQRWTRVLYADNARRMREQWRYFYSCYKEPIFAKLLKYIEKQWINESSL